MTEKTIRDISSRKILGMTVYSCKESLNLGSIKQLLIDIKTFMVQGFLLEKKRGAQYERILPFSAVYNFGEDGVTVETASRWKGRGQNNIYVKALRNPQKIIGARVFTTGGRTLGKIDEYCFNSESGKITGLEIAPNGFFKVRTLVKGEHLIAISGNTAMLKEEATEDAVSIDNSFISNMSNAADTVKGKAGEIVSSTADITKRFSSSISERIEKIKKREEDFLDMDIDSDGLNENETIEELILDGAKDSSIQENASDLAINAEKSTGTDRTDAKNNLKNEK